MMYNQKMIVAVKANGKILREFQDVVKLPFGSEYSLLIKNIHHKRAQVSVEIDGQDVLNGRALIINPNSETELSRFVNDLSSGNSFKFIERTEGIEQHRGIKLDDGIIRVSFQYEATPIPLGPIYRKGLSNDQYVNYSSNSLEGRLLGGDLRGRSVCDSYTTNSIQCSTASIANNSNPNFLGSAEAMVKNDVGITVAGSINHQRFTEAVGFPLEQETHIMVLRLSGLTETLKPIIQPVTVKMKPTCTTCGKINVATNKFCSECGISLTII